MVLSTLPQKRTTAAHFTSQYLTDLAAETEASSSHVTTEYVESSSSSLYEPSPLTAYTVKPSYNMDTEDHMRR